MAQLILSLAVLTAAAEALVRGASRVALHLGVSPLFIGLTIVGFGTSAPELSVSVLASLKGSSDISVGNVIGSNLFNIGFITGLTALILPIRVRFSLLRRELGWVVAAACAPLLGLAFGWTIPRALGLLFLLVLATFVVASYRTARGADTRETDLAEIQLLGSAGVRSVRTGTLDKPWAHWALLLGGLVLLIGASRMFVDAALTIARSAGVSELLIGLTIVAGGTSLPELITSIVAARRGHADLAMGNVIGSNIFNVFGILGAAALIRPQSLQERVLTIDVPVMILATLALVPLIRSQGLISRREGCLLLAGYAVYFTSLVLMGP